MGIPAYPAAEGGVIPLTDLRNKAPVYKDQMSIEIHVCIKRSLGHASIALFVWA